MGTSISPETVLDDDEAVAVPPPADDENETLHEHEQAETEPEPEQEASAPASEKEIEKALKAVERAGTTYRNAIGRAMGEDAQALEPCPRCNAPVAGMIFPVEVAPVSDEDRVAVLASIGEGPGIGPPLQDARGVTTCPTCLGHGQLKYPTLNPHVQTQQCPKCAGQGYVNAENTATNVSPIIVQTGSPDWTPPVVTPACSRCGMAGMEGQPHYCAPAATG